VSEVGDHRLVIERRGRSHRARCACGWSGHAWNELRPAEADAWHHVFGDDCVIDISTLGDGAARAISEALHPTPDEPVPPADPTAQGHMVESLVNRARAIAGGPSPYRHQAISDLRRLASDDRALLQAALTEIGRLLTLHERHSARTADSEWLELITAKRLLQETLEQEASRTYS
jgi:hypothetical protein